MATLPSGLSALGPGAALRAMHPPRPPLGVPVCRGDSETPLVTLGLNVPAYGMKFDIDGRHLVWGSRDGTVTVADLTEVNNRLAEFKLGW